MCASKFDVTVPYDRTNFSTLLRAHKLHWAVIFPSTNSDTEKYFGNKHFGMVFFFLSKNMSEK